MKYLRSQNVSLERLCRQSDTLGKPVLAISSSGLDQIKVTIGRVGSDGKYLELRLKVLDSTDDAIEYAKETALVVGTNLIYEIRIFKDYTSEFIRILQDRKTGSKAEKVS